MASTGTNNQAGDLTTGSWLAGSNISWVKAWNVNQHTHTASMLSSL